MSRYTLTTDFVARRMASDAMDAVRAADARSAARNLASARADLARARAYAAGKRQTRFPPDLGIPRSTLYSLVYEQRPVTAKARARLLAFCEAEPARQASRLTERLALLASAAAVIRGRR